MRGFGEEVVGGDFGDFVFGGQGGFFGVREDGDVAGLGRGVAGEVDDGFWGDF